MIRTECRIFFSSLWFLENVLIHEAFCFSKISFPKDFFLDLFCGFLEQQVPSLLPSTSSCNLLLRETTLLELKRLLLLETAILRHCSLICGLIWLGWQFLTVCLFRCINKLLDFSKWRSDRKSNWRAAAEGSRSCDCRETKCCWRKKEGAYTLEHHQSVVATGRRFWRSKGRCIHTLSIKVCFAIQSTNASTATSSACLPSLPRSRIQPFIMIFKGGCISACTWASSMCVAIKTILWYSKDNA